MRPFFILAVLLCFISLGAKAEGISELTEEQLKLRKNERVLQICNHRTVHHVPDADVEYVPGIDAKGNFIVAPDIGLSYSSSIYPLKIPLELNIIERFDLDVPTGIISNPEIAGITVYEDGKITYNGHNVSKNVEAFCLENKIIEPAEQIHNVDNGLPTDGEVMEGGYH